MYALVDLALGKDSPHGSAAGLDARAVEASDTAHLSAASRRRERIER